MLENHLHNPLLKDIESRKVEKFLMLVFHRAKYSAGLYLRTLKASFNKAIQWGYIDSNPFNNIKLPKSIKHIPEFIGVEELNKIIDLTDNLILKDIFVTAFYTGLRQSELINLKWNSIDFSNNIITVKNSDDFTTKSKKERIIPMNNIVIQLMKRLKKSSTADYIFPNAKNYKFHPDTVSKKFKKAVRAAKLSEAIHFHTLRHSFASNLVRKGVSLYVVKELLGHEDISTTQIYAHLDNKALINAINLL
jgi:integrase/recombinase XerD